MYDLFFSLMYPPLSPVSPPSYAASTSDPALASNSLLAGSSNGSSFGSIGALNPKPSTLQLQQPHLRASSSPGIAIRKNPEERIIKIDPSKSFFAKNLLTSILLFLISWFQFRLQSGSSSIFRAFVQISQSTSFYASIEGLRHSLTDVLSVCLHCELCSS